MIVLSKAIVKGNTPLLLGLFLLLVMFMASLLSVVYTPHDPYTMAVRNRFAGPSSAHWFGTDQYGRDVFSRIVRGGRTSLFFSLTAVLTGMTVGTILGGVSGYLGGGWDELLMRLADGFYAFPAFLLALLAVTLWGPGTGTVMVAIAVANMPIFMRIVRSNVLSLREAPFVEAAKASGASDWRVVFRHMLPNLTGPLGVQFSASLAAAILAEASLSYLGVGIQPPDPSWGRMLREAQSFAGLAPWTVLFPGLCIALTVLGFNLVGDGLQG